MTDHLRKRIQNRDRAFKRNMLGKPIYNKKGKLVGRRAPTATDAMRVDAISRMAGGMDYLTRTDIDEDANAPQSQSPLAPPRMATGPSGEPPQSVADQARAAGQNRATSTDASERTYQDALADLDKLAGDALGTVGSGPVADSTVPRDLDARIASDKFMDWWFDPKNSDPENPDQVATRNEYAKAIAWKARNLFEQKGDSSFWDQDYPTAGTGEEAPGLRDFMGKISQMDLDDPANMEEIVEWVNQYVAMAARREQSRGEDIQRRQPRYTPLGPVEPGVMPGM